MMISRFLKMARRRRGVTTALTFVGLVSAVSVLALPSASAQNFGGNVSVSWSIPRAPSTGLTNVTFPIAVDPSTVHARGLYFAQQFEFTGGDDVGYTGLQPRADSNGHERMRAVFSSFQDGATTSHPNCSAGADGGPGVSCGVEFDADYTHPYRLKVARTATNTWTGTVIDAVSGRQVQIGTWRMPSGSGLIVGRQGGFVEYYDGAPTCDQLARADVTFGAPTTTSGGGLSGASDANYEYGECVGEANYQAVDLGSSTRIVRGWISEDEPPADQGALRNSAANRCLDDPGSSATAGTVLIIWDCHGGDNQKVTRAGEILRLDGLCLDAQGGATADGTRLILWECHGGANQNWQLNSDGTIRGAQSGKCLQPVGSATGNGTEVALATCGTRTIQKWTH